MKENDYKIESGNLVFPNGKSMKLEHLYDLRQTDELKNFAYSLRRIHLNITTLMAVALTAGDEGRIWCGVVNPDDIGKLDTLSDMMEKI